jgi:ferritin-like metal-binding protein YciE
MAQPKNTLLELLTIKMQALYDIELQLTKALPDMAEAANDNNLKEAFEMHLEETENHVSRLEQGFLLLSVKPKKLKVEAIRGLIDDGKWVIKQKMSGEAIDAMLVGAASAVEHYEMAGYLSAKRWADEIGKSELSDLFQQTLEEEIQADKKLSNLAETTLDSLVDGK